MNNKFINIFCLTVICLSVAFCGGKAALDVFALTTDVAAPTLKAISFSPSTVISGGYFVITITVSDDSSGVKTANIILESPSGQYILHAEPSYGDSSGNWRSSLLMPADAELGTWTVKSVYLADNSGNNTTLYYGNQISYTFNVAGDSAGTVSSSQSSAALACVSFDYGDWSNCQKNGTQVRSILNAYPLDCVGGSPVLTQACTYLYQCNDARPYLNDLNKTNCIDSRGTWDSSNCICSCPTGWHFEGTGCIYTTTTSTTTSGTSTTSTSGTTATLPTCTSFTYSDWSTCESNGTQSRTILSSSPDSCINGTSEALVQACTYIPSTSAEEEETTIIDSTTNSSTTYCNANRPYLDELNKSNCISSTGTWNSTNCVCSCPTGWHFEGTGCLYTNVTIENTCTSFTYSDWSECVNGKQSRTVTKSLPAGCTGGTPEEISRYCIVSTTCTKDEWVCGEWSVCANGTQKRTCTLSYDCTSVKDEAPKTDQACVSSATTAKTYCTYTYSDWSECVNGKQSRTISTRLPSGCIDKTTEALERTCVSSCSYTYSDWSSCVNDKRTRTVLSQYPDDCSGYPALEESCTSPAVSIPDECVKIGWYNEKDCELYTYREKIISECKANNLTTKDSCREYMLNTYGKPSKCNDISGTACDSLIDNVILSNFKIELTAEVKQQLSDVSGMPAVINTQNRTITVQTEAATSSTAAETKEVKVEEMPLASSTSGDVSVSLLPTNSSSEANSSPVAIAFDSDGDGLPDDLEKRLGTDPYKKDTDGDGIDDNQELKNGTSPLDPLAQTTTIVLSGVDKAVVSGKTLEQPKATQSTVSASLAVNSVETENNNLKFQGKAEPNQIITLFIYSVMPIVVTVQADANGNWVYELDKTLVDGTHEAYVAINDDEGKIVEASLPTPFFIAQAQAVSVDNFVDTTGDASQVSDKTNNMMILYVLAGAAVIIVLIAAVLIIRQRYAE